MILKKHVALCILLTKCPTVLRPASFCKQFRVQIQASPPSHLCAPPPTLSSPHRAMVITSLSDMNSFDCFSDVSGKKPKPQANMCVFGIMMGQEVIIRSLLVLSSFLFTLSVVFLLGFVLVFFIVEIWLFSASYCGVPWHCWQVLQPSTGT